MGLQIETETTRAQKALSKITQQLSAPTRSEGLGLCALGYTEPRVVGRGQPASYKNQRRGDFSPGQRGRRRVGKTKAPRSHLGQGCHLPEQGCPRSSWTLGIGCWG